VDVASDLAVDLASSGVADLALLRVFREGIPHSRWRDDPRV